MKIFLSYTTRFQDVTSLALLRIANKFKLFSNIYIDLIDNDSYDKQTRVEEELDKSDIVILVLTDHIFYSEWVNREITIAQSKNIPIIPFTLTDLELFSSQEILRNISKVIQES